MSILSDYGRLLYGNIRKYAARGGAPSSIPGAAEKELGVDTLIARQRGPGGFSDFANPDDLAERKGLDIYDRMMTDAQVRMAVNYKRFAVISADWDVLPGSSGERDKRIAAFVKRSIERMNGSLIQGVFGVMHALVHGYSISELVFERLSGGEDEGLWGLAAIRPKHPSDYDFELDRFGNLTGLVLIDEYGRKSALPMWKFVIYTYLPEFGRPWGRSDLRAVYKHWWSKDFLLKWWNIYLETYGAPTRIGKYPAGGAAISRQEDLKRVLRDIVNNTAITIPDDMNIEFITAAGDAGFEAAIDYHDRQIVKGILGQTLTSDEGRRVGSMALGSIHQETLKDYVTFLRADIAESVMNEQVIKRLVAFNFDDVEAPPKFVWQPRKGKITVASVGDIAELISCGIVTAADYGLLRERLDLPPAAPAA
ncbi:MAG TPA: DUF935 family protein [bacterium]|nr:DUF935 family protein [bacterium]